VKGLIAAIVAVIGGIFAAGKLFSSVREHQEQAKLDVNRIGAQAAGRREERGSTAITNICMVIIASEDERSERFKIAGLPERGLK